ncbi:MAG: hypothetical protein U0164_20570 [Gemmatimonadaceae bacterium]
MHRRPLLHLWPLRPSVALRLALALLSVGATALVTTSLCESPGGCTSAVVGISLGGAVIGGLFGLIIGAGVGHVVPHWRLLHP